MVLRVVIDYQMKWHLTGCGLSAGLEPNRCEDFCDLGAT
jgi:hypothetical protein